MKKQNQNNLAILIEQFGRHVVALCIGLVACPDEDASRQPNYHVYPATVLVVRNRALLLTAGHILAEVDAAITKGTHRIKDSFLLDVLGGDRVFDEPVPFDYSSSTRWHINHSESGLDFGLVLLEDHYVRLLRKNRIIPIHRDDMPPHDEPPSGSTFYIYGFPAAQTAGQLSRKGALEFSPSLVEVKQLSELPPEIPPKTLPRFYATIPEDLPFDIRGMSGGPVFGVWGNLSLTHRVVAIQTSLYRQNRIIGATYLSTIMRAIELELSRTPDASQ